MVYETVAAKDTSQLMSSYTDIFKDEYSKMVGYVKNSISDSAERDAEDIVQDVFYSLFDRTDVSAPIENLISYAYRSLRNKIIDTFRTRKKHTSLDTPMGEEESLTLLDLIESNFPSPQNDIEQKEIGEYIFNEIYELNEDEQAIILATEVEGYNFRELSEEWGVSINTLLSRKSRAMKKLAGRLKNLYTEYGPGEEYA